MILVTGASGTAGAAVLRLFDQHEAVAGVRDRRGMPANARTFDFEQPDSWALALRGIEALFLMLPPGLRQAKERFRAIMAEARIAGVRRVVFLSIRNADRLTFLPHRGLEQVIEASGVAWTHVRPNDWMQNFATQPLYRDGIRAGELWSAGGRSRTSYIDVRDVAEVVALALRGGQEEQALSLTGPAELTLDEIAASLSQVLGRRVRYRAPSLPAFAAHARQKGAPWPLALVMTSIGVIARLGYADGVDPTLARLLGREGQTFEQFARDYREAWLPEA